MEWQTTTRVLESLKGSDHDGVWQDFRDTFFPVVVGFARHAGLSETDAEDAAQETMIAFVKAYREGKYDREKGRLRNWLFGLARHAVQNAFRKRAPERLVDNPSGVTAFWNRLPDENAVEKTWAGEWRKVVLDKCLRRAKQELDEKTFSAFELYVLGEQSVEDVAKRLNMSENAVYIAKSRVIARLRQLEEEFEGFNEGTRE